ncbi:MAG: RnfABCDGE type electron transport complex subunit D [Lachnospiraceae bacterium]|nr:RnfABCDGE type electron transport complex subunit D [Lachnospiraceae bacterium]
MENLFKVSSNPHVRDNQTTSKIMLDVLIALIPASIFGVYNFGISALILIIITVASAMVSEAVYNKLMKKKNTVGDLSAAVTGLLLALNLPGTNDIKDLKDLWWIAVLGAVFAIVVVKMLFGGLGQNFMNPALGARCFLLLSFTSQMTNFSLDIDGVTSATPLYLLKHGESVDVMKMFIGRTAGTIGETSALAIIIGGIYLLVKRIIDFRIPVFYIGTFAIFAMIYTVANGGLDMVFVAGQLCGGGLMLGAWFMATDYVTSPITKKGKIVYGICLGLVTGMLRLLTKDTAAPEGVSYAIIFCNLLVPLIEKFTAPRAFGKEAKAE